MRIRTLQSAYEREPLAQPFGFKGGYLTELWQTAAWLEAENGTQGLGLGTQSVLWSDAEIFKRFPEIRGNELMFQLTRFALTELQKTDWRSPLELLEKLYPTTLEFGRAITRHPALRATFALNALVAVDNAAWQLYAAGNKIEDFDRMIPPDFRGALSCKETRLAQIPLITYGVPLDRIEHLIQAGSFFLKIKIGSDPDNDGSLEKMLDWDTLRLTAIHDMQKKYGSDHTENGKIGYYLDANGRYDTPDRLMRFLDHAEKIGALEQIMLLEEPFDETHEIDVKNIPVRLAADESAHTDADAAARIEMGYRAIALKPIAKTLSMSLKIAKLCQDRGVPCFCADLTVNPILVDWNKNVAARLARLPGFKTGVLESNGAQNYKNWTAMNAFHPCNGAKWIEPNLGFYELDASFYEQSGGIFQPSAHYKSLILTPFKPAGDPNP